MILSLACGRLESVVLSFCIIARRSERGMGSPFGRALACCKVGLERPLIPTAVVANLFRSARVFRWDAASRGLGDQRSQRTGGSGAHCPNQRIAEFRQPSMPEKQVVSVLAIFYLRGLRRFALTGHWTLNSGH